MNRVYQCFPGGKFKALTMSYDDGRTFDRKLVEIFNRYGIRGTFHLNSGFLGDNAHISREEAAELYRGHEIACHTVTHPTIVRLPLPQAVQQVLEDRRNLEEITGNPVRGLSYPNGSYSQDIEMLLKPLGIEYARIVGSTDSFGLPENFYEWQATCHHNHNLLQHADEFVSLCKSQYLSLMYVWGHSYEFDRDGNWNLIEEFCKRVSNRDDMWYATNIEIVDTMTLWKNLQFTAKGDFVYNPCVQSAYASVEGQIVEIKGGVRTKLF